MQIINQQYSIFILGLFLMMSLCIQGTSYCQDLSVGEDRTVRLVYFLPNDRPYRAIAVQKMKEQIILIQSFFAEQMQSHGYGEMTFSFETDDQGEPMVHRVDGRHPDNSYGYVAAEKNEIEERFNLNKNVYLIVSDKLSASAGGYGSRLGKEGGAAYISGAFLEGSGWRAAAHELGHAFGLLHNFSSEEYLMSYGTLTALSACAAELLSVHPYFNPDIPSGGKQSTIAITSSLKYPGDSESVSIQFELSDSVGLHQVSLSRSSVLVACLGLDGKKNAEGIFDYDGYFGNDQKFKKLSSSINHNMQIQVVNTDGNTRTKSFVLKEIGGNLENKKPVFAEERSTSREVAENTPEGVNIGEPVSATDFDKDKLDYSITGDDRNSFSINRRTGQLKTKEALDYETKKTYSVEVIARDANPGGRAIISVTIFVTKESDDVDSLNNAPVFTEGNSTVREVAENTPEGVNIGEPVSATDADDDTLTYTLLGEDAKLFTINTTNGQLQTRKPLNYESKNTYIMLVVAKDAKHFDSITVTVNVIDVAESHEITVSEIMFHSNEGKLPQWIELYNPSNIDKVNLKDWEVVIKNKTGDNVSLDLTFSLDENHIVPQGTFLIVTKEGRSSHNFLVQNLNGEYDDLLLSEEGFYLKLLNNEGELVDEVGNLITNDANPELAWSLPISVTDEGARASIIRRHDKRIRRSGTEASGWISAIDTKLATHTTTYYYYGNATDIGTPRIRSGGALPVTLSSFRAEQTDVGVIITWETESEIENAGFNILRSETKTDNFKVVNPKIIQGSGTTGERHTYTWKDTTAKTNIVYYYRIEDISYAGVQRQLATVRLKMPVSAENRRLLKWATLKRFD